jgi:1,4-dihydroxy-2-naphthoate octaprenyltransferase
MSVNLGMWVTAVRRLVRLEKKEEWDALDVVSKWLIATRSAVTTVTLYSCAIAGLLALRNGGFSAITWLVLTVGLFFAHGANNLLNDYTDYRRGIDNDNYFRTQYGVHPLVQKFWDKPTQLRWFTVSGFLAVLAGLYALLATGFDPLVIGLFAYGALMLLLYTYPLKHFAVGELTIFLIWGPVMIGGVYYVLTRHWDWNVALAGIPFGLSTASINLGKHIDKSDQDRVIGVTTLPVLIGETAARLLTFVVIVAAYAVTVYLVFIPRFLSPVLLIVFLAGTRAFKTLWMLSRPRPKEAPKGYGLWPAWFSAGCFYHNRRFGNLFVLGVLLDTILRMIPYTAGFWR